MSKTDGSNFQGHKILFPGTRAISEELVLDQKKEEGRSEQKLLPSRRLKMAWKLVGGYAWKVGAKYEICMGNKLNLA